MTTSRASATGSTAVPAAPPEYTQFYLANMYVWKKKGVKRVLDFLKKWNVDCAHYHFDDVVGWFGVRCLRSDAKYIQAKFLDVQDKIEQEIRGLNPSKTAEAPFETFNHPDVERPTPVPHALDASSVEFASDTASSLDFGNGQHEISLEVPESLQEFPLVDAWLDLQPRDKSFHQNFYTEAAKKKIEQTHNVMLVADEGQKVILMGGSDAGVICLVKAKLSTLLHDFESSDETIPHLRHVFFVSQPVHGNWEVDIRKIVDVNPDNIRRSTILDPWRRGISYDRLDVACCLRACLEDPFRKVPRHALWSVLGPRPKSILETQKPRMDPEILQSLTVAQRQRVSEPPQIVNDENGVADWLQGVPETKCAVPVLLDFEHDEPVLLDFEHYEGKNFPVSSASQTPHPGTSSKNRNILDQDDPVLQDPGSALQRPMLPAKRKIRVAYSHTLSSNNAQPATSKGLDINQGKELDRLVISVQNLLRPMPVRYGLVELRVEMGRFFATKVPTSGLATNRPNTPARGWDANILRKKMDQQESLFTKALSCFGNDADMLAKMKIKDTGTAMWKVDSRDVFLDFRFEFNWDLVLEVNTKDYSWRIRVCENDDGSTYVHCLRQNWDFRVRLAHDRPLEWEDCFGEFARALIDSLQVRPPELDFKNLFDDHPVVVNKDMPIRVTGARIRQVCRLQHHDKKTYLDITRVLPTKAKNSNCSNSNYAKVASWRKDKTEVGEFCQWYEAALSSARLEEVFRENANLIPGDKAGWNSEDLTEEIRHLCEQAACVVEQMDPVGVGCDNGFVEQVWNSVTGDPTTYAF